MRVLRGADLVPSRGKAARTVLESDSSLQEAGNAWLLTILCRSDGGNDFSKPLIGRTEATTYFSGRKIMVTRVQQQKGGKVVSEPESQSSSECNVGEQWEAG